MLVPADSTVRVRHEFVALACGCRDGREIAGRPITVFRLNLDDVLDCHRADLWALEALLDRGIVSHPAPEQLLVPVDLLACRKFGGPGPVRERDLTVIAVGRGPVGCV